MDCLWGGLKEREGGEGPKSDNVWMYENNVILGSGNEEIHVHMIGIGV